MDTADTFVFTDPPKPQPGTCPTCGRKLDTTPSSAERAAATAAFVRDVMGK